MSQADFRFFNIKHSMHPHLRPPLKTLQITDLELFYTCSRWHIKKQTTLNLKGPKTAVATTSPAIIQAQAVLLGHGCVPSSLRLQRLQEIETDIHKCWSPIISRTLAAVGLAPAMNVD